MTSAERIRNPSVPLCLPASLAHLSLTHRHTQCAVHSSIFPLLPDYSLSFSLISFSLLPPPKPPDFTLSLALHLLIPASLSLSPFPSQEVCVLTLTHTCGEHTFTHRERGTLSLFLSWKVANLFRPLGAYTSSEKEGKGKEERELETRVEEVEGDGEEGRERRKEREEGENYIHGGDL